MSQVVFDDSQVTAIELAAERVAQNLGAMDESGRRTISRAVFYIAKEANLFDPDRLVEIAERRLKPHITLRSL